MPREVLFARLLLESVFVEVLEIRAPKNVDLKNEVHSKSDST